MEHKLPVESYLTPQSFNDDFELTREYETGKNSDGEKTLINFSTINKSFREEIIYDVAGCKRYTNHYTPRDLINGLSHCLISDYGAERSTAFNAKESLISAIANLAEAKPSLFNRAVQSISVVVVIEISDKFSEKEWLLQNAQIELEKILGKCHIPNDIIDYIIINNEMDSKQNYDLTIRMFIYGPF